MRGKASNVRAPLPTQRTERHGLTFCLFVKRSYHMRFVLSLKTLKKSPTNTFLLCVPPRPLFVSLRQRSYLCLFEKTHTQMKNNRLLQTKANFRPLPQKSQISVHKHPRFFRIASAAYKYQHFFSRSMNTFANGTSSMSPVDDSKCKSSHPFECDVNAYHEVANATLHYLLTRCEELEDLGIPGFDVQEHDGVLELRLGAKGTYVINKQTPNRQLWLSSPVSGPKRYNYDPERGEWRNTRDGHSLFALLSSELTQLLNKPIHFSTSSSS